MHARSSEGHTYSQNDLLVDVQGGQGRRLLSLRGGSDCNLPGSQVAVHTASNLARYQLGGQALLAKAGASSPKGLLCCAQLLMPWPGHITALVHSPSQTRFKRPMYVMEAADTVRHSSPAYYLHI